MNTRAISLTFIAAALIALRGVSSQRAATSIAAALLAPIPSPNPMS